jgi:hypothetical protein
MTEFGEPVRSRRNVARDTINEYPQEIEHFIVVDLRACPAGRNTMRSIMQRTFFATLRPALRTRMRA